MARASIRCMLSMRKERVKVKVTRTGTALFARTFTMYSYQIIIVIYSLCTHKPFPRLCITVALH